MEDPNNKALEKLRASMATRTLDEIATLTNYRKEKLYQWERLGKFPSAKVAKKILKAL